MNKKNITIFAGNSNQELAKEIAKYLGLKLGKAEVTSFKNGEIYVKLNESVRGKDVFIIQSTSQPVNDHLMELLLMIDAAKRCSAGTINAVLPWYGYSLQDRQTAPREPISSKLVADLISVAGTDRVLGIDLHASQIQGFFDIPFDHLTGMYILANYFKKKKLKNVVVVSPDAGGTKRARMFAKILNAPIAMIDKRRPKPEQAEVTRVVGEVKGKTAIVVDDLVNSGSTLTPVTNELKKEGSTEVYFCSTHAILCGDAVKRIKEAPLKEIVFTNTIKIPKEKRIKKVKVLSIARLLGEAIRHIHENQSVSELFERHKEKNYLL